jgi:hypothetical protein
MTSPYTHAEHAALAAAQPGTPAELDRLCAGLAAYRHVLTSAGLLPRDTSALTADDVAAAAQHLAGASRHPRYSGDGWNKLLAYEGDVDMAYDRAAAHAAGDPDTLADLGYSKRVLLSTPAFSGPRPGSDQP